MAPNVDVEILKALGLQDEEAQISSHGGSGFSSTFKLTATKNGQLINYFVKTGAGENAELMFKGTYLPYLPCRSSIEAALHVPLTTSHAIHSCRRRTYFLERHPRRRPPVLPQIPRPRPDGLGQQVLPRHRLP